jgi:hypothetical protein
MNARLKDKVAIVTSAGSRNDGIANGRAARDPLRARSLRQPDLLRG